MDAVILTAMVTSLISKNCKRHNKVCDNMDIFFIDLSLSLFYEL